MTAIGTVNGVIIGASQYAVVSQDGNDIGAGGFIDNPGQEYVNSAPLLTSYIVGLTNNATIQNGHGQPATLPPYSTRFLYGPGNYVHFFAATNTTPAGPVYGRYGGADYTGYAVALYNRSQGATFVTNNGTIIGGVNIEAKAAVTINNLGSIDRVDASGAGGTITNSGAIGRIVYTDLGVINAGLIASTITYASSVVISTDSTVTNQGTILGSVVTDSLNNSKLIGSPTAYAVSAGYVVNSASGTIFATGTIGAAITGPGAATITNAGLISAAGGSAILADSTDNAPGAFVNNLAGGTISATGAYGIIALDEATIKNAGTISVTGHTSQGNGAGIGLIGGILINQPTALISSQYGSGAELYAYSAITSDTTLLNYGTILSQKGATGVISEGDVTNGAGALVSGQSFGVALNDPQVTVTNKGTIVGAPNAAAFHAGIGGIGFDTASVNAYVTNASNAVIYGGTGILDEAASGTIVNAGTIEGAAKTPIGVLLQAGGTIVNQPGGTITTPGSLALTGNLRQGYGVVIKNGAGIVSNAGDIYAHNIGVDLEAAGVFKNQVSAVVTINTSLSAPLYTDVALAGTTASTVVNAGTIGTTAAGALGSAVTAGAGIYLTNQATGTIGGIYGVHSTGGPAKVTNAGTIVSVGTYVQRIAGATFGSAAILLTAGTGVGSIYVQNAATGLISGAQLAVGMFGAPATLVNSGTVTGGASGVMLSNGGDIVNNPGGVIAARINVYGTSGGQPLTVTNAGYLLQISSYASTITNQASGLLKVVGFGTGTLSNQGTIVAITALTGATVINQGTIQNSQTTGFGVQIGGSGSGALAAANYVANKAGALIQGYYGGVYLKPYGVAVQNYLINSGTIVGGTKSLSAGQSATIVNASSGIILGEVSNFGGNVTTPFTMTLLNSGAISSGPNSYDAIRLQAGEIVNQAGGLITGLNPAGAIHVNGGTVVNAGIIRAAPGSAAITFNGGNGTRLVVEPGAVFGGTVINAGVIEFAAGTGQLTGLGTSIVNFGAVQFDPGAYWTVSASANAFNVAAVTGFDQGSTIDISGLVANGDTYSNGVLTLLENDGVVGQITIATPYATPGFSANTDNNGGTDITVGTSPQPQPYQPNDPLMTNTSGDLVSDQVVGDPSMVFTTIGALGPEWEFDGAGSNLLGDGNPGFLIRNTGTIEPGALFVGEVVNGSAQYTPIGGIGLEWQFEGNDDFLSDGQSQFLIRNTGSVEPGVLDLGQVVNGQMQFTTIGGLGLEWQFEGNGDFLGNGSQQFLFRNTRSVDAGALYVGQVVNGNAQFTPISGVGTEWDFEGVGDFFGDDHTDFLAWNSGTAEAGAMAIGEIVNGQMTFTDIGGVGPEWEFVGTGNYIDSNKSDFLLRNTGSGALVVASVSGGVGNANVSFTTVGGVGPEWTFQNTNPALLA